MKHATTLARVVRSCALIAAIVFVSNVSAEEYNKSYTVEGRPNVRVDVDDSSVRVITSDTSKVEFHVTYEGFTIGIGGDLHVDSQQSGNQVTLTAHTKSHITIGINTRRLSTEVYMPKNADLQIDSSDGSIDVASVNGNITVQTKDGAVKATQLTGKIDLATSDGNVTVDTLKGQIRLHSGDGAISGGNLDGKCEASTTDGQIHLAGRFDTLSLKSSDGAVSANAASGSQMSSDWEIKSSDGSVDVALPKDLRANLDASTGDGRISVGLPVTVQGDMSKTHVQGTINGGGPVLRIRTSDGSIHVRPS
jgi:DUF4097 and DUF4098 domain-containing protein YvlB